MTTNHFRVTAYHPTEDITILIDSYGVYEKLWQLSSMLVLKGFNIIEASDSTKFVNVNIPDIAPNTDKLYLRACMVDKPDIFLQPLDAKRSRVVQVENRMYIPDKTASV
ncbi:MAG: hypothetical protein HFJ21_07120 [Clostridia bacterium]|jgi:hypothetical protein|nr:hypothetical protein [Clostridia bacterium]MCI9460195.1 hypothetical protein [Clostridia bacterium]